MDFRKGDLRFAAALRYRFPLFCCLFRFAATSLPLGGVVLFFSTMKRHSQKGFTLLEQLIVMLIVSILGLMSLPSVLGFLGKMQISSASTQLRIKFYQSRMLVTSESPNTACIWEDNGQVKIAAIEGDECELVTNWDYLPWGISIDKENSTLRTVSGVAGNEGVIYRASWANTEGGDYGSYGQLGRITLMNKHTPRKVCAILYGTDGSWQIASGDRCIPETESEPTEQSEF